MLKKDVLKGTIRVKVKGLQAYEKTATSWKKCKREFPELKQVVKLFKAHKNLKVLVDKVDSSFLKGQLSPKGEIQGARVNILPDGQVLDKAYSLFAKHLRVHDQDSEDHWDVLFQNKGGTWNYAYTKEKIKQHRGRKFRKVAKFDKVYTKLLSNVTKALRNKEDHLAIPMFTLLKTHMRVGNETYFKAHGHKGLTTLLKKDVSIKGNQVMFNYLAKDGVPREISLKFTPVYVKRLKGMLKGKKNEFIFANCKTGHPINERIFKKAFLKYCGKEFYPHIVRSHYATKQVQLFLKGKRKVSKEEVEVLYKSIAAKLGHKKFVKKKNEWQDSYSVTVSHYIQPEMIEKVKRIMK